MAISSDRALLGTARIDPVIARAIKARRAKIVCETADGNRAKGTAVGCPRPEHCTILAFLEGRIRYVDSIQLPDGEPRLVRSQDPANLANPVLVIEQCIELDKIEGPPTVAALAGAGTVAAS